MSNIWRRLRGAVVIAVLWGAGWFAAALGVATIVILAGLAPAGATFGGAIRGALMFSVMGTIAGTAFSTFIGLRYHGHQLSKISWIRFGIVGGIVTGLFVPGFISFMRLISGDAPLALKSLLTNGTVGLVFGAAAAAASMKLAQLGRTALPGEDSMDELGDGARSWALAVRR